MAGSPYALSPSGPYERTSTSGGPEEVTSGDGRILIEPPT
jgi:hypothetical protein